MRTAKRWLLIAALVCPAGTARAVEHGLSRDAFQNIRFTDTCTKEQWSTTPDDTLEVILSLAPDHPCGVQMPLLFPSDTSAQGALQFEARSLQTGQLLEVELTEDNGNSVVSRALPPDGLTGKWSTYQLHFDAMEKGWAPKLIRTITFRALQNSDVPNNEVFINNIHFLPVPHAAAAPARKLTVHAAAHAAAPAGRMPAPEIPAWAQRVPRQIENWGYSLFLSALVMVVLGFAAAMKRKRPARLLSPLYEMNVRTWGTHRDTDGVLHVGGFRAVAFDDLKRIKDGGFDAIWFMGIWEIGAKVRRLSKNYGEDYVGSPFAIADYAVSEELGSEKDFLDLVDRAHAAGLSVIVDFIPNHMGMDCLWLNNHPDYFIHKVLEGDEAQLSDEELLQRYPGYFPYRTPAYPVGEIRMPKTIMVAYGKDPYFFPWIDTAQLDYANPALRRKLIDVLSHWAQIVDGVRCDMAMLVLREQVKIHRHPEMSWDTFNRLMPHEFWSEAIAAVKRLNPQFSFIGETYWAMEGFLQRLGFDFTYNKPLYEAICAAVQNGHAEGLANFLRMLGTDFLQRSVHFLENHDEERAMNTIGLERQRAAAAILASLPGITLVHQGQMEGRRERMPVQRIVPLTPEEDNEKLKSFYRRLLQTTRLAVFRTGRIVVMHSNNPSLLSYSRVASDRKALVVVNVSGRPQKGSIFLTPGLRLESGRRYRFTDRFHPMKTTESQSKPGVQERYEWPAASLMNQGLYVELEAYDSHLFVIEALEPAWKTSFAGIRKTVAAFLPWPRITWNASASQSSGTPPVDLS